MVGNQAKNDKELYQMLKDPLKVAVRILMEKILAENNKTIKRVVYGANGRPQHPVYYRNTYEFLDAWDVAVHATKAIKTSDVQGGLFYRPSNMETYQPSESNNYMGQHHGITSDKTKGKKRTASNPKNNEWRDSREYLAELIYEGASGKIYGDGYWTRKRNAYEELVKVLGVRRFKKMMTESLREAGLNIKVHAGAIPRKEFQ